MQVQVIWMLILAKNTLWNNPWGGSWGEMHLHWLKHSRPCLFPPTADWAGFSPRTLCSSEYWLLHHSLSPHKSKLRLSRVQQTASRQEQHQKPLSQVCGAWPVPCSSRREPQRTSFCPVNSHRLSSLGYKRPNRLPICQRRLTTHALARTPLLTIHTAQPPILRNRPHTNGLKLRLVRAASTYMSTGTISTKNISGTGWKKTSFNNYI